MALFEAAENLKTDNQQLHHSNIQLDDSNLLDDGDLQGLNDELFSNRSAKRQGNMIFNTHENQEYLSNQPSMNQHMGLANTIDLESSRDFRKDGIPL